MLCYCFLHTVQCGVRVTLLHLVWGGTLLTTTVSLQIGILTYEEWVPEAMGRRVKEEMEEEEVEVIMIGEEDAEGVGRETMQGGEVHPSGGTDSSFAGAVPTLEIQHAVDVSQGRALPANTTIIAPLAPPPQATSSLPGPGPLGALTPGVRKAIAQACEKAKSGAVPSHHSPRSSRPAPCPTPQSQASTPAAPVRPTPQPSGASASQVATEPPLPQQKLLSEVPLPARGARWHLRQKSYVPWTPSQTQLWEARCLLTGEGEWAAPKCVFVPEGDQLHRGAKSSKR